MQPSTQASARRVLFLLFLANLFNFFDRTIPAIIAEPIRLEWSLNDFQLGLIGTAFTIVYAIAGLPLGRMADTSARGARSWAGAHRSERPDGYQRAGWNFWSFLLIRMGIGIGEASYAPAANSLIGDLFPRTSGPGHGHLHAGPAAGAAAGLLHHRFHGRVLRQLACALFIAAVPGWCWRCSSS